MQIHDHTKEVPFLSKPLQDPYICRPVAFISRMLASTSGMPVRPSRQRSNRRSSLCHSTCFPVVPYFENILFPCLMVKNLGCSTSLYQQLHPGTTLHRTCTCRRFS